MRPPSLRNRAQNQQISIFFIIWESNGEIRSNPEGVQKSTKVDSSFGGFQRQKGLRAQLDLFVNNNFHTWHRLSIMEAPVEKATKTKNA